MSGGAGSGIMNKLMTYVAETCPKNIIVTATGFPSGVENSTDNTNLEVYNSILALHCLTECPDVVCSFSNNALYKLNQQKLHIPQPVYADLNHTIAQTLCNTSASMRFPGMLNMDLRNLATNLIMFPRMKFLNVSNSPLTSRFQSTYQPIQTYEIMDDLLSLNSCMVDIKDRDKISHPTFLSIYSACLMFRGKSNGTEIDNGIISFKKDKSSHLKEWIPDNFKYSMCGVAPPNVKESGTMLMNSSTSAMNLRGISYKFTEMFRKKAFLHWYIQEGMDEMEFTEAESNANDLLCEYFFQSNYNYPDEEEECGEDIE